MVKANTDRQENSRESGHSVPQFQSYKYSASTYPMQSTMLGIAGVGWGKSSNKRISR